MRAVGLSMGLRSRLLTRALPAARIAPFRVCCPIRNANTFRIGSVPRSEPGSASSSAPISDISDEECEIGDDGECISPLMMALNLARQRLVEVAEKRARLEQKAQDVAQAAVEAVQAHEEAQEIVEASMAELVASIELQKELEGRIEGMTGKTGEEVQVEEVNSRLKAALARISVLCEEVDAAKKMAADKLVVASELERVAAKAMRAAEAVVKEEIQANAVAFETQEALNKTSFDISMSSDAAPSAAATIPERGTFVETAFAPSAAPVEPVSAKVPDFSPSGSSGDAPLVPKSSTLKWAALAVALVAVAAFVLHTTNTGQSLMTAAAAALEFLKDKVSHIHVHEAEKSLLEAIWLLIAACICVPFVVSKIPGGNPVLGYLLGGALVGPHALGIIQDVKTIQHIAELGVVFLLFNIGLELSLDRLRSMAKQVFGMGSLQVGLTIVGVVLAAQSLVGLPVPSGIILGGALAMSSTAVGIQVLEDRGEMGSRHGRGIFSVLLFQDLAVVLLLMLIPLLAPSADGSPTGMAVIAKALGLAAVKAVVCIVTIIAGGRLIIRPLYKQISGFANSELLSSLTLLVCLGTSFLTSLAGLSLALGAFLAGLLIAETEFAMQVESDIAPYKGLLLGLFFMSVGMEISGPLFVARWKEVLGGIILLVGGKLAVVAAIGPMFGLSKLAALRAGLLIAPGGEFAFVAFGEAVTKGVLPGPLTSVLYLVVALSMACIPYLAMLGGKLAQLMEAGSSQKKPPNESETKELKNHVIIAGYGRSGQLIAQLLSENRIPFVAITTDTDAVAKGRALDLPIYFGDPGSPSVLHHLGAERAACAVITMNTPGANYRVVWAMNKHFPNVKTFVRAHDILAAVNLEKAGATAVVPETLEPSLQLVAAALSTMNFKNDDVSNIIDDYRRKHTSELKKLTRESGTTVGYHGVQSDSDDSDDESAATVAAAASAAATATAAGAAAAAAAASATAAAAAATAAAAAATTSTAALA